MINLNDQLILKWLKVIGSDALAVLLVIAVHADTTTGKAWPGEKRIMFLTGLGRDRVRSALKRLKQHSLLRDDLIRKKGKYVRKEFFVNDDFISYYLKAKLSFTEHIAGTPEPLPEIQAKVEPLPENQELATSKHNILDIKPFLEKEKNTEKEIPKYRKAFLRLSKRFKSPAARKELMEAAKFKEDYKGELEDKILECCEHHIGNNEFLEAPVEMAPKYLHRYLRNAMRLKRAYPSASSSGSSSPIYKAPKFINE